VLLAPLPYPQPDELVSFRLDTADGTQIGNSPAVHATYQRFATQLEGVALYRIGRANVVDGQGEAQNLTVSWVSASLLQVLRVAPVMGRAFTDDETRRDGPQAVILSEREWRTRFAAAPDVIGKTLLVNDVLREIVGVMPSAFAFPSANTRLWLPARVSNESVATDFFYHGVARLATGATREAAEGELASILPRMAELYPQLGSGGSTADWIDEVRPLPRAVALRESMTAEVAPMLWLLGGVAVLVVLVAWANVANLTLIRADAASRDAAVRESLGASALRASAPFLGEAVALTATAALLAVVGTAAALRALRDWGPDLPRLTELSIGPLIIGFIVAAALSGCGLVLLACARRDRAGLARRMQLAARQHSAGSARQRFRATVSVLQIAAALVVLAGSALLMRTAQRLQNVDPGFDAEAVSTFQILLPFARYGDSARVAFHARLIERVRALPSVHAAGLTARLPLAPGATPIQNFRADGTAQARPLSVNVVSDGYLPAMQIPLRAGRDFRALELQRPDELLINQRAALELFADGSGSAGQSDRALSAIGRTLTLEPGGPAYTVVGVVGDVRYDDLATPAAAMVYRPQVVAADPAQPAPLPGMTLVVRSSGAPEPLVAAVRSIVRDLDPGVPVFEVSPMSEVVRQSLARLELLLTLVTAAAIVTLALAMLGLYGVIAYLVALRKQEFGVRRALGATAKHIVLSVFVRGLRMTAIGLAAGLAVYALAAASLRAAVLGVQPWDPLSLVASVLLLIATAALATWLPARRAAANDPMLALRAE
jgi:predicted permease